MSTRDSSWTPVVSIGGPVQVGMSSVRIGGPVKAGMPTSTVGRVVVQNSKGLDPRAIRRNPKER